MVLVDRLADRKKIARTQHSGKRQHCRTRRGIHTLYFLKCKKISHEKQHNGPGPPLYFTLGCNSQPDKDKYYFHSLSLSHCHRLFFSFIQPNIFFAGTVFYFLSHFFVPFILFILLFVRAGGWSIKKGRKCIFCTIFYVQIRWQRNNFIPVR